MDAPIEERLAESRIKLQTLHQEHKDLIAAAEKSSGTQFETAFKSAEAKQAEIELAKRDVDMAEKLSEQKRAAVQRELDAGNIEAGNGRPALTADQARAANREVLDAAIVGLDFRVPPSALAREPRTFIKAIKDRDLAIKAAYALGMFYSACYFKTPFAMKWCQANGYTTKAQAESDNPAGGFLVPAPLSAAIITIAEQFGVVRRLFRPEPMTSETLTIPRTAGIISSYWIVDGQTITPTTQTYDAVELIARKLAALLYRSSEVAEDAVVDLGEILGKRIAWAFRAQEDAAGLVGDGTSKYGKHLGVINRLTGVFGTAGSSAGIHVGTAGSGSNWASYTLGDFTNVMGLLPDIAWEMGEPTWLMSRQFYSGCVLQLLGAGGGNTIQSLMEGPFGEPRFMGLPVVFAQTMPRVPSVTTIDAMVGNFELAATFGDRRQITLAQSTDFLFGSDQIAMRGIERIGINVHDVGGSDPASQAINPANAQDGTTKVAGPVVGLLSASS